MWVEFVVGSCPCSKRFISGYSGSLMNLVKNQHFRILIQSGFHSPRAVHLIGKWTCNFKRDSSITHSSWSTNACSSLNWSMNHPFFLISKWLCILKVIHYQSSILLEQQMTLQPWRFFVNHLYFWISKWPWNLERDSSFMTLHSWTWSINHPFSLISKWPCCLRAVDFVFVTFCFDRQVTVLPWAWFFNDPFIWLIVLSSNATRQCSWSTIMDSSWLTRDLTSASCEVTCYSSSAFHLKMSLPPPSPPNLINCWSNQSYVFVDSR